MSVCKHCGFVGGWHYPWCIHPNPQEPLTTRIEYFGPPPSPPTRKAKENTMSTERDELADIKSRAEKFIAAHDVMIQIDQGIGGLAVERPDLMPDWDAWYMASDVEHADTVLAILEALKPQQVTTADELAELPVDSVLKDRVGDIYERVENADSDLPLFRVPGIRGYLVPASVLLPATVLHVGGAE